MTKDEFCSLPVELALSIIWDVASQRLRDMPAPPVPRRPKYDGRLGRDGGFVWYSELDFESLDFWQKKNAENAAQGGRYAERNGKTARALEKWVTWRRHFPHDQWRGIRGEDKAVAALPVREPTVNKWQEKSADGKKPNGAAERGQQPPPEEEETGYDF